MCIFFARDRASAATKSIDCSGRDQCAAHPCFHGLRECIDSTGASLRLRFLLRNLSGSCREIHLRETSGAAARAQAAGKYSHRTRCRIPDNEDRFGRHARSLVPRCNDARRYDVPETAHCCDFWPRRTTKQNAAAVRSRFNCNDGRGGHSKTAGSYAVHQLH